jgi:hypothetical protein
MKVTLTLPVKLDAANLLARVPEVRTFLVLILISQANHSQKLRLMITKFRQVQRATMTIITRRTAI